MKFTVVRQIDWQLSAVTADGEANVGLGHTAKLWKDHRGDWHWELYRAKELLKKGWDYTLYGAQKQCQDAWEDLLWKEVLTRE